jgi:hypothetical protein
MLKLFPDYFFCKKMEKKRIDWFVFIFESLKADNNDWLSGFNCWLAHDMTLHYFTVKDDRTGDNTTADTCIVCGWKTLFRAKIGKVFQLLKLN